MNGVYITGLFSDRYTVIRDQLVASGASDYILWSIHVNESGDLNYNNQRLAYGGQIIEATGKILVTIVEEGRRLGSCERVWISLGSAGVADYRNMRDIISIGGAKQLNLLNNIKAVAQLLGAVGFDFDFEEHSQICDADACKLLTDLTVLLFKESGIVDCKFTFCPYKKQDMWFNAVGMIFERLGEQPIIGMNLQCYCGGRNNLPTQWVAALSNFTNKPTGVMDCAGFIFPLLATQNSPDTPAYSPEEMMEQLRSWSARGASVWNAEIVAAGALLLSESSTANTVTLDDYARAISAATR